jgi:cystathionine beta-lyase
MRPAARAAVAAMLDGLRWFKLGVSWGGFESLILPVNLGNARTVTRWEPGGPYLRLHVGLEDPDDLIADLAEGLARLRA